jgi:hypothetical protein
MSFHSLHSMKFSRDMLRDATAALLLDHLAITLKHTTKTLCYGPCHKKNASV